MQQVKSNQHEYKKMINVPDTNNIYTEQGAYLNGKEILNYECDNSKITVLQILLENHQWIFTITSESTKRS